MWIESLIISGLKSFLESPPTRIDFHEGLNVVLGINGSGKSNLLWALDFVLEGKSFGPQARPSLLPDMGCPGGASKPKGYVLLLINNEDRALPLGTDTVSIKRLIDLKSDLYTVNSIKYSREDFLALMSLVPPHSFIRQGEVTKWALSSPKERLELIESSCGINCFNAVWSKIQSLYRNSIQVFERMESTSERIKELMTRHEALYQKDLQRKDLSGKIAALKSILDQRAIRAHETKTASISEQLSNIIIRSNSHEADFLALQSLQEELGPLQEKEETLQEHVRVLDNDLSEELAKGEVLEAQRMDLKAQLNALNFKNLQRKALDLKSSKSELETRLPSLRNELESQRIIKHQAEGLYERAAQFRELALSIENAAQPKEWVESEVARMAKVIHEKKEDIQGLLTDKNEADQRVNEIEGHLRDLEADRSVIISGMGMEENVTHYELMRKEAEAMRELNLRQKECFILKEEIHSFRKRLSYRFKPLLMGIESMRQIYAQLSEEGRSGILDGFYGLLVDCVDNLEDFVGPVSVVGGEALFYHVVATKDIANQLIKILNDGEYPGQLTFLALDNLKGSMTAPRAQSLFSFLELSPPEVAPALGFIFGKWILVETLSTDFGGYSNAVTIDGDTWKRNGVMEGGFRRPESHAGSLYSKYRCKSHSLLEVQERISELLTQVEKLAAQNAASGDNLNNKKRKAMLGEINLDQIQFELRQCETQMQFYRGIAKKSSESLSAAEIELEKMEEKARILEAQRVGGGDLMENMVDFEGELKGKMKAYASSHAQLRSLIQEEKEVESRLRGIQWAEKDIADGLNESNVKAKALESSEEAVRASKENAEALREEKSDYEARVAKLGRLVKEKRRKMTQLEERAGEDPEQLTREINFLSIKQNQYLEEISRIRKQMPYVLEDFFIIYKKLSNGQCLQEMRGLKKRLDEVSNQLGSWTSYDLQEFIHRFKALMGKYDNLRACGEVLVLLLDALRSSRDKTLQDSMESIGAHFEEVFPFLGGSSVESKLSFIKDDEGQTSGVDISVSFLEGGKLSLSNIKYLSGGQQTLVALAFIFSVQMHHPSTCYVMDEVDAALDPRSRGALSRWIKEYILKGKSSCNQVIFTSFRREIVEMADQCIQVRNRNGISSVGVIGKKDALEFVTKF